jgi:hypothetical protein
MGYNSVAVIYNDHIGQMKDGGTIGSRIAKSIQNWSVRDRDPLVAVVWLWPDCFNSPR